MRVFEGGGGLGLEAAPNVGSSVTVVPNPVQPLLLCDNRLSTALKRVSIDLLSAQHSRVKRDDF